MQAHRADLRGAQTPHPFGAYPVIFTEASRHAPPAGSNQLGNYQSTVVSCSSARVMVSFENLPE